MSKINTIIITGASSGLGKALSIAYASSGVHLFLTGRNDERLQDVAKQCQDLGAIVDHKVMDIKDEAVVSDWISSIGNNQPIDLLIANAGISAGTAGGYESEWQTREIFSVNVGGVLNVVLPVFSRMVSAKSGQIAIVSSLASMRGLPSCPAYSASKAAMRVYGEALRSVAKAYRVKVSVVLPGYVKTPMTDVNKFPMPMLMSAEQAAKIIKHKLKANPARITFPWLLYFTTWLLSVLPITLSERIVEKLPAKESFKE